MTPFLDSSPGGRNEICSVHFRINCQSPKQYLTQLDCKEKSKVREGGAAGKEGEGITVGHSEDQ